MSRTASPESVLQSIPGWEDATVAELAGGLTNRSWLVAIADRKAVLKIDAQPRAAPYNRRDEEAQAQSTAARAGLAGQVLYVSDTAYLCEYLEGEVWTHSSFDDDRNLEQIAAALRRLHSLPLCGRSFDARQAARGYAALVDPAEAAMMRDCLQLIDSMPRLQNICFCHNDLVVDNIIATPEVRFLDWEYACDNDPFFDLATLVAHHRLSDERAQLLLNAYFDGDGQRWWQHLTTMSRYYNALLWLWLQARRSNA